MLYMRAFLPTLLTDRQIFLLRPLKSLTPSFKRGRFYFIFFFLTQITLGLRRANFLALRDGLAKRQIGFHNSCTPDARRGRNLGLETMKF